MRILLTGAGGFLGARALARLRDAHDVRTLPSALLRGDMTAERADAIRRAVGECAPQAVLHFAAISDTGYCERNPEESHAANALLPEALARACAAYGARLVCCSSDQVYFGCAGEGPFDENAPLAPANVYGRHKLEAERRVLAAAPDALCLRLTWMYDLPAYGMRTNANLLVSLLTAAERGQTLRLSPRDLRGVTYARQVVDNLLPALALAGGVYNFGSECALSAWELATRWRDRLGLRVTIERAEEHAPRSLRMDCARLTAAGICFDESEAGLERCLRDYGWMV